MLVASQPQAMAAPAPPPAAPSPMPTEPGLKVMRTFYRRAAEIDGSSTEGTVVAHYCRCHAMQKAIGAVQPSQQLPRHHRPHRKL